MKPQTLAFALNDSPVGLASWTVEKFDAWSGHGPDLLETFPADMLLDNLMIYWATETIGSSMRLYYDSAHFRPAPRRRTASPCRPQSACGRTTWCMRRASGPSGPTTCSDTRPPSGAGTSRFGRRPMAMRGLRAVAGVKEGQGSALDPLGPWPQTPFVDGVSQLHQGRALRTGVDVILAAPGRLLDLIGQRLCDLSQLEALRFSATMPRSIASLA